MGREKPEGQRQDKSKKEVSQRGTERKQTSKQDESRGEPKSVSVWRSGRGSAHLGSRHRAETRAAEAREGRLRQRPAGVGGTGGLTWVRKAGPKTIVPTGLESPGGWESGRAGARSPIRAAGTVLRLGAAGGRGQWRGGRRAAAPPGRRASCWGPRGAGDPPGRRRLSGAGSPQLGTEVPLEHWAPAAGCWEPSGAWLDVPVEPGGPFWVGLRLLEEGNPLGRGPSPGCTAPSVEPRGSESARGIRGARRS